MADIAGHTNVVEEDMAIAVAEGSQEQAPEGPVRTGSMVTVRLSDSGTLEAPLESPADDAPAIDPAPLAEDPPSADGQTDEPGTEVEKLEKEAGQSLDQVAEGTVSCDRESTEVAVTEGDSGVFHTEDRLSKSSRSGSSGTQMSAYSSGVDWDGLEKSEEQEARDETSDESTALLLARLEQENDALATDPKSNLSGVQRHRSTRSRRQSRPPSIHYLKSLVDGPTPAALRYSLLPAPPPMTDLEFYAALVADYPRTAQCLPTLLSKKVRSGIPPPLRGVVWVSMSGARDQVLEEQYERLSGESSPYENLIGKDIGRSFPGVEMFREPGGEGQRKLGQVLKCFSLYDQKIGYCQGLGFLVGPLLMHMEEKEAFCVLVRLMEHYDLRSCFLPDLSGLHLRIYQFRHLLAQQLPKVATHLEDLQVNPAYVSQWFLSFFAVTCPLPMLLRIYDVIFAEGASETLMRVALSLMRRNESKILSCSELEDVMQLLLSRGIWDAYNYNADDFVGDFVELTGAVARDGLLALETSFKEAQNEGAHAKLVSLPDLQAAASRFLGRFWAGSSSSTKTMSLSPGTAVSSRPASFLHRSPSKHSIASTLNSCEVGSESGISSLSTDATTMSRQLSGECLPPKAMPAAITQVAQPTRHGKSQEKDLHGQIEDLLMALSEMQKNQAAMSGELQREREEREQDGKVVDGLVRYLKKADKGTPVEQDGSPEALTAEMDCSALSHGQDDQLPELINAVEKRFASHNDASQNASSPTTYDPRTDVNWLMVQYEQETSRCQQLQLRVTDQDKEMVQLKEQLREARSRIQESHKERQRLESTVQDLRSRKPSLNPCSNCSASPKIGFDAGNRRSSTYAGLREFKLNKSSSANPAPPPSYTKRTSSLSSQAVSASESQAPPNEEALVLELINSKTAEALAKQEAEELRSKLESLRKMLGTSDTLPLAASSEPTNNLTRIPSPPETSASGRSVFGSLVSSGTARKPEESHTASASITSNAGGGFWAGWGKRTPSNPGPGETK